MSGSVVAAGAVSPARFAALGDEIGRLYQPVFARPPWNETADAVSAFVDRLPVETGRAGFAGVIVRNRAGALSGFAYGYTTARPFPRGRSYDAVRAALGDVGVGRLSGRLEVLELAVHPNVEGVGIGRTLLDSVVAGRPSWLLTSTSAVRAVGFYRRRGWQQLGQAEGVVVFANSPEPPV